MTITNNKLVADEGMTLTNGETFGKVVHLARGASADQWWEITDAEAEAATAEVDAEEALQELRSAIETE